MIWPEPAPAIAYLRTDISGTRQTWHEIQMRSLAIRLGYNLRLTVALSDMTDDPISEMLNTAEHKRAEAVFVPSAEHVHGHLERVKSHFDVIVSPEEVYARWSSVADMFRAASRQSLYRSSLPQD